MRISRGFLAAPLFLAACTSAVPTAPPGSAIVPFERPEGFPASASGLSEAQLLVLTRDGDWAAVWSRIHEGASPPPARPTVDFARQVVLVAARGTRPTGGYAITVEAVVEDGSTLRAQVVQVSPGPTCVVPQVVLHPLDVVVVPRAGRSVLFFVRSETRSCG